MLVPSVGIRGVYEAGVNTEADVVLDIGEDGLDV